MLWCTINIIFSARVVLSMCAHLRNRQKDLMILACPYHAGYAWAMLVAPSAKAISWHSAARQHNQHIVKNGERCRTGNTASPVAEVPTHKIPTGARSSMLDAVMQHDKGIHHEGRAKSLCAGAERQLVNRFGDRASTYAASAFSA